MDKIANRTKTTENAAYWLNAPRDNFKAIRDLLNEK